MPEAITAACLGAVTFCWSLLHTRRRLQAIGGRPVPEATWTAPEAGHYHFVSGREPHLERDCTEGCLQRLAAEAPPGPRVFLNDFGVAMEQLRTSQGVSASEVADLQAGILALAASPVSEDVAAFVVYVREKCRGIADDVTIPVDLGTARAIAELLEEHDDVRS